MQYQPLQSHAPSQAAPLTSPSLLLTAVLLGFVYAILSTPAAYTSNADTLAAIIWPAPAVACALIWRLPYRQWWPFVVAIFVAMIFVGGRDPLSLGADMAFAVLNIVQVVLYTFAGRRFVSGPGAIDTTAKLARYMLFLPLLVNGVTAAIGATIGMVTKHTNWMDEWRVMLVGNGLAILVLLPALLAWFPQHRPRSPATPDDSPWPAVIAAVLGVLLLMVSALVPGFPAEVMRALLSLVLVWAAIQGGIRAASLGLLAAAVAGIGLALSGHGAYGVLPGQGGVWELQVDLAGLAVLSFFVAITVNERQKINLRLERARRFETMGFLTGGIAHDFNNILGAVGGYAELATEREKAGLPVHAALGEVSAAVARGKDLTEQILLAGRRGARTREVTDLRTLVSESVALARALLPAGIQLHVHVPLLPVAVTVHRGQLVRAILNLLRNASQAAVSRVDLALTVAGTSQSPALADAAYPADPDTVVGEVLDHSCVWLDVVDDGAGVAAEHIHQLFDPFFSSRSSPGSKGHGTGLGLAIVAGVVSDHSGGVAVWSSPGTQTRFRLMLPLALAEEVAAAALVDLQPLGNGEAVLVVAADALVRETLENAVAELGFEPAGHDPHETSGASLEALRMADGAAQFVVWAGPADSLLVQARLAAPHLPMVHYQDGAPQASPQAPAMVQNGTLVTITGEIDSATLRHAVKMVAGPAGFSSLPGIAPQFA